MLKAIFIILIVLIYWKFVYYKYHNTRQGALVLFIPSVISIIIGLYSYFFEDIFILSSIFIIYFIVLLYYLLGLIFIYISSKKHGLSKRIDVLAKWTDTRFGRVLLVITSIVSIPLLFFSVVGTYYLFGVEHIYLWIMIFFAWTRSGIRLVRNYVMK